MEGKEGRRLAMVIDLRKCYGCNGCTIACKSQNNVPLGKWRSWVKEVEVGTYPYVKKGFLPRLCMQCADPVCVRVCPTKASHVDQATGIIRIDPDLCIGCAVCVVNCPYRARFINPETRQADKCDFCFDKITMNGEWTGELPACVDSCPPRARVFGDLNDPNSEVSKLVATEKVQLLNPEHGTRPQIYYIGLDTFVAEASNVELQIKRKES